MSMPTSVLRRLQCGAAILLALLTAACGGSSAEKKTYQIAVIPKGTTHQFWNTIHAGAARAEREFQEQGVDVRIIWKGPLREDDREQQIQVVEGFLSQGVSGIAIAPLDSRALVRPVEEANAAGIPVLVFDSGLETKNIVSYVATDNEKGGRMAGEYMGKLLGGKGRVLLLRYQEGSASTEARERGFIEAIKEQFPDIDLISSDQYAGPTRDTAKRAAENLLNRYTDVQGVFCVNESSASGMLLALQDLGRAGKVKFLGFDAHQEFLDAMARGEMDGFVLQNPFEMGYLAVKTMVQHLQGQQVPAVIDTGVHIVTRENMNAPAMQDILKPPVEQYLKQ